MSPILIGYNYRKMEKIISYAPVGVCSSKMDIVVEEGVVRSLVVTGGCNGNRQAVERLVKGMRVEQVIELLQGIDCKGKGTSCPDQLVRALIAHCR